MKTCTKCQTENEQENKFCKNCRAPLFQNEQASADGNDANAHKKTKMMCPKCRMVYEKEERCVKCKGKLVPQESLEQKVEEKNDDVFEEEHPSVHEPPAEHKEPAPPSQEMNLFKTNVVPDPKKESSPSPTFAGAARRPLEDTLSMLRLKKRNSILSPLNLAMACVIVVVGVLGYQWTMGSGGAPVSPSAVSSSADPAARREQQETETIKALLENIRLANLQKNIDLFMSCYALDFKDRESKKRSQLEMWKNLHYLDLSYNVKNQILSGDTADIEVEWRIKTSRDKDGPPQEGVTVINASLKKEEGAWRIKETRTPS
jgi:RNase P subunit RPR2